MDEERRKDKKRINLYDQLIKFSIQQFNELRYELMHEDDESWKSIDYYVILKSSQDDNETTIMKNYKAIKDKSVSYTHLTLPTKA